MDRPHGAFKGKTPYEAMKGAAFILQVRGASVFTLSEAYDSSIKKSKLLYDL